MNCFYSSALLIVFILSADANFADKEDINDDTHLNQHLEDKIDTNKERTPEERRFYYFKQNDPSGDDNIDGLEIINAIVHEHNEDEGATHKIWTDEELIERVDEVLAEMDLNKDGLIDYSEYSAKVEI